MALDPKATASSAFLPASPGGAFAGGAGPGRIARLAVIVGRPAPRSPASAAPPEAGRDAAQAIVVCTAPDVCKTPITGTCNKRCIGIDLKHLNKIWCKATHQMRCFNRRR